MGNFDQDLNVGMVDIQQSYAMLYVLKMMGYKEYFGIDINPEHMSVQTKWKSIYKWFRRCSEN
ncbi:MAG: hypothetical protein ACTSWW_03425 [Promethearchaeota archaeon]